MFTLEVVVFVVGEPECEALAFESNPAFAPTSSATT